MNANTFDLQAALNRLPSTPGIYRMYDDTDVLIYVGKAKNLKNRVRSYFQKNQSQQSLKVVAMVQQIRRFDYIVTDTEIEALILEANLIKQHKPKYNILLRDDKKYPWLVLSNEPFPRLFITRNIDPANKEKSKTRYFGPYTNSGNLYETLKIIRRHFPLRQRRKPLFKNRPCMNYYIGHCLGPCQKLVTPEAYQNIVHQVTLFLNGKTDELLALIQQEMEEASLAMNFEWAAKLRDRYQAVQTMLSQRQKVVSADPTLSQDIIAVAADDEQSLSPTMKVPPWRGVGGDIFTTSDELYCAAVVLNVRQGKLLGSKSHELKLPYGSTIEEAYSSFVTQYYESLSPEELPDELVLQFPLEDEDVFEAWLNRIRTGHKKMPGKSKLSKTEQLELTHPQRGAKRELLDMALKNAKEALAQNKLYEMNKLRTDPTRALMALQEALDLPDFPVRMECYDISHFQGSQTVASMVVFTDGVPDKKAYRRFKIQTAEGKPDDFKSMAEVIRRRFAHAEGGESADSNPWPDPDLVIIDGGKGQLHAAVEALRQHGIENQPIISLSKKFEEVHLPDRSRPVLLSRNSTALFLLQQIRDEAHRFAITYHRNLRDKTAIKSELDDIPGIGEKRKNNLLSYFGSVEKIKAASPAELAVGASVSTKVAEKLFQAIHQGKPC